MYMKKSRKSAQKKMNLNQQAQLHPQYELSHRCVCVLWLCKCTAQNSSDNVPSYDYNSPDSRSSSDRTYWSLQSMANRT